MQENICYVEQFSKDVDICEMFSEQKATTDNDKVAIALSIVYDEPAISDEI